MDGHWKFQGGGGPPRPKIVKEFPENWGGGGVKSKNHEWWEVWLFFGTTQLSLLIIDDSSDY